MKVGRTAIITDASHPAAEAIAERLESRGISVVRNYPRGLAEEASESTGLKTALDTCSLSDMQKLAQLTIEKYGSINYLIHSDNVIFRKSLEDITDEEFMHYVHLNAKSAFISTKVIAEHIAANQGGGVILYLSSLHDEKPTGCAITYSAGKGAVKMLCREMALFFGRKGVRANLIELDAIGDQAQELDSMISRFQYDAETKIPLKRRLKPEDVPALVEFLLSDEASYINGAEVRVDGGHLYYYIDR